MDEKTYKSLKKIIAYLSQFKESSLQQDIEQVAGWIDEAAKEYPPT